MASRRYSEMVTMTVRGEEVDVRVRALVDLEYDRRWLATIDGSIEVLVDEVWIDVDDAGVTPGEIEHAGDVLCESALSDDSGCDGPYDYSDANEDY